MASPFHAPSRAFAEWGGSIFLVCFNHIIIGSIFSYFANKYFTFKVEKKSRAEVIRFIINIIVCYFLSYGIARPIIDLILNDLALSKSIMDQISMLFGTGIFIVFNYFGQKFFVFKK